MALLSLNFMMGMSRPWIARFPPEIPPDPAPPPPEEGETLPAIASGRRRSAGVTQAGRNGK